MATIPSVKSTVSTTTHVITFTDGIKVTIVGSNTIATRKKAYEAYIASHPKLTTVKVSWTVKKR